MAVKTIYKYTYQLLLLKNERHSFPLLSHRISQYSYDNRLSMGIALDRRVPIIISYMSSTLVPVVRELGELGREAKWESLVIWMFDYRSG